jgi:hypothetical protein
MKSETLDDIPEQLTHIADKADRVQQNLAFSEKWVTSKRTRSRLAIICIGISNLMSNYSSIMSRSGWADWLLIVCIGRLGPVHLLQIF